MSESPVFPYLMTVYVMLHTIQICICVLIYVMGSLELISVKGQSPVEGQFFIQNCQLIDTKFDESHSLTVSEVVSLLLTSATGNSSSAPYH